MGVFTFPPGAPVTVSTLGLATDTNQVALNTQVGATNETAPATDVAASGLNGRLQRIAQRLTTLIGLLPASLGAKTSALSLPVVVASDQAALPVSGTFFQATQPVSASALPLPLGAATEVTLVAMSGKLPATVGQKAMAASLPVAISSDQSAIPVSGTFYQATQPVSLASVPTHAVTQSGVWSVTAQQAAAVAKTTKSASVVVGTTAIRATTDNVAVTAGRVLLRLRPKDTNTGSIYIGGAGVTTTTGMLLYPGESVDFLMDAGEYYVISDQASQGLYVLEQE